MLVSVQAIPLAFSQGPSKHQVCAVDKRTSSHPRCFSEIFSLFCLCFSFNPSCTLSLPSQLFLCSLPVCLSTCPLVCLYPFPKYPLLFPSPINFFYPRSIVWNNFLGVHLGMDPSKVPETHAAFLNHSSICSGYCLREAVYG